jgi:hypothetical protein
MIRDGVSDGAAMLKRGFVVAMAAEFSFAVYDRPATILRKVKQWIIVSRCGPNSEFVTVANAAGMVTPGDAPLGLTPIKTAVGILSSESEDEITFLLVRQRPPVLPIAGAFFPADGHMRIVNKQGTLELLGVGRHAHSLGRLDGRRIRKDVPDPAPNARGARAWHIHGIRQVWVGELLPNREV